MKKRVLSILLCLCMVIGLLPTMALAADVSNAEALAAALGTDNCTVDGNKVTMTARVDLTDTINIKSGTIILDLAGKTITGKAGGQSQPGSTAISIGGDANVTIKDSVTNGKIVGGRGDFQCSGGTGIIINTTGDVTISGSVSGANGAYPGGKGGTGITVNAVGNLTLSGNITGGDGGGGGDNGYGGNGGSAVSVSGGGSVTLNGGSFTGGNGGDRGPGNGPGTAGKAISGSFTVGSGKVASESDDNSTFTPVTGNNGIYTSNKRYVKVTSPYTENTRNQTLDLTGDEDLTYYTSATDTATVTSTDILTTDITNSFEGWAWYTNGATVDGTAYTGKVLVLKGTSIQINTEPEARKWVYGIKLPGEAVTIVVQGTNSIQLVDNPKANSGNYGIDSSKDITFNGNGTLGIHLGTASGQNGDCYGISSSSGNITVDGTTIAITVKSTESSANGIFARDTFTLTSGSITAQATKEGNSGNAAGIFANTLISLEGGTVNVTATSKDSEYGYGLGGNDIQIKGGTGEAHGNESVKNATKVTLANTVEIKSGSLTGNDVTWGAKAPGGGSTDNGSSYDIKITKEGKGTVSPDGGVNSTVTMHKGTDQAFTFTPDKGYVVSDVKVDGKSVGAVKTYVFTNVTGDHTIAVTFQLANGHKNPETGVEVSQSNGASQFSAVKQMDAWFKKDDALCEEENEPRALVQ